MKYAKEQTIKMIRKKGEKNTPTSVHQTIFSRRLKNKSVERLKLERYGAELRPLRAKK